MRLVVLNSCCLDLPTWAYLKLWAKIDPFSHKLIFPSNRAYPWVPFIMFPLPCFLAQGFSLLRSSSGRIGWLASKYQGCAHLHHVWFFCMDSENWTWIFIPARQALCWLHHLHWCWSNKWFSKPLVSKWFVMQPMKRTSVTQHLASQDFCAVKLTVKLEPTRKSLRYSITQEVKSAKEPGH